MNHRPDAGSEVDNIPCAEYKECVPLADKLYDEHLEELRQEGLII